jgi:hypothetical protein
MGLCSVAGERQTGEWDLGKEILLTGFRYYERMMKNALLTFHLEATIHQLIPRSVIPSYGKELIAL